MQRSIICQDELFLKSYFIEVAKPKRIRSIPSVYSQKLCSNPYHVADKFHLSGDSYDYMEVKDSAPFESSFGCFPATTKYQISKVAPLSRLQAAIAHHMPSSPKGVNATIA